MNATEQQRGRSRHHPNSAFDGMTTDSAFDGMTLGALAGRLTARRNVLAGLLTDSPASVLVQRLCPDQPSLLAGILSRRTALMVKQTINGNVLRPAAVFTPVPDRHRLVRPDGTVSQATRVPFVRPLSDFALALRTLAGWLEGW